MTVLLSRHNTVVAAAAILLMACSNLQAQTTEIKTEKTVLQLEMITDGLEHPWGLAVLPDGNMLVTEWAGRMRIIAAITNRVIQAAAQPWLVQPLRAMH